MLRAYRNLDYYAALEPSALKRMRLKYHRVLPCVGALVILICISINSLTIWLYEQRSDAGKPRILFWANPVDKGWRLSDSSICGGGCIIKRSKNKKDDSDAVVFYMKGTNIAEVLHPSKRPPNQVYVWWCKENPWATKHRWNKTLDDLNGYFNWTMHYRSDSYITAAMLPHTARDWYLHRVGRKDEASVAELKSDITEKSFEIMFQELIKLKSKSAAWVVSNCHKNGGAHKRREFADKIQREGKYKIDIFGKCGNLTIPKKDFAIYDIIRTYKFYLAFENMQSCKEYITEKFWYNSLYAGTVPVVWGPSKKSVEKVAPPGSFIHVEDFDNNVTRLADYLRMLENDVEKYKDYFKWWNMPGFYPIYKLHEPEYEKDRVSGSMSDYEANGFCHLCRLLKEGKHKSTTTTIASLKDVFYGPESADCIDGV